MKLLQPLSMSCISLNSCPVHHVCIAYHVLHLLVLSRPNHLPGELSVLQRPALRPDGWRRGLGPAAVIIAVQGEPYRRVDVRAVP